VPPWVSIPTIRSLSPNRFFVLGEREAVKKLKIGSSRQEACAGAPAPPRWNVRSARVFGCGFRTEMGQDCPDSIFHSFRARVRGQGRAHSRKSCFEPKNIGGQAKRETRQSVAKRRPLPTSPPNRPKAGDSGERKQLGGTLDPGRREGLLPSLAWATFRRPSRALRGGSGLLPLHFFMENIQSPNSRESRNPICPSRALTVRPTTLHKGCLGHPTFSRAAPS